MDFILKALLNEQFVEKVIFWQALIVPIIVLLFSLLYYSRKEFFLKNLIRVGSFGLIGPIILFLWKVYNKITAHYGLDTVKNLLINLVVFVITALILGVFYRIILNITKNQSAVISTFDSEPVDADEAEEKS